MKSDVVGKRKVGQEKKAMRVGGFLALGLRQGLILAMGLSFVAIVGCFMIPAASNPLGRILSAPEIGSPVKPLVVMLPGMGDRMGDFVDAGFVDSRIEREFDAIAVDAHFGYYHERNLVPRLHEDVIMPARAAGYERIWLLGISMGGFGALRYASEHPSQVAGVILLSPYLGNPKLIREIEEAGGLQAWTAGGNAKADFDEVNQAKDAKEFDRHELAMWQWLKTQTMRPGGTPIILGFSRGERLAETYGPLFEVLDVADVYVGEGGHKWVTWKPLWQAISAELNFSTQSNGDQE